MTNDWNLNNDGNIEGKVHGHPRRNVAEKPGQRGPIKEDQKEEHDPELGKSEDEEKTMYNTTVEEAPDEEFNVGEKKEVNAAAEEVAEETIRVLQNWYIGYNGADITGNLHGHPKFPDGKAKGIKLHISVEREKLKEGSTILSRTVLGRRGGTYLLG